MPPSRTPTGGRAAGVPAFNLTLGSSVDANSPGETSAPTITTTLPSALDLIGTPLGTDWDCSASVGQSVSCTYTGDLPLGSGSSLPDVTVPVQLAAGDQAGDQFQVSDTVSSADSAPFYAASTATETLTVSSAATVQLGLTETDSGTPPGTIYGGTPFSYTLTVTVGAGGQPSPSRSP